MINKDRLNSAAAPAAVGHPQLNKGAVTRLNNDRIDAQQSLMQNGPGGGSASRALKQHRKTGNPRNVSPVAQQSPVLFNQRPSPPQAQPMPSQMLDPVDELQAHVDLQEFLSSPEFGDALTNSRLDNYFKGKPDDPQTLALQVLQKMAGHSDGFNG